MRELRHEMQRASVLSGASRYLAPEDFNFYAQLKSSQPSSPTTAQLPAGATLQEKVQRLERQEITAALGRAQGNRTHAARALGLSRQGLLNKMERYGVASPSPPDANDDE